MKTLQFKTTLKCAGCVNTIKPNFDQDKNINSWEVDLNVNPKVLTVTGENITVKEIEDLMKKSGYSGELIASQNI